jgi:hypothetical protein
VVEPLKSLVGVFGSSEHESANTQQFIDHAKVKKKISLKTLAKVLGNHIFFIFLISVQLQSKSPKTQSAGETMQMMEDLVEKMSDSPNDEIDAPNPRKRRFEEIENDHVQVKSERSMSSGSSLSGTTNNSSIANIKMEYEPTNTVDEETSNAASILNGVASDRRTVSHKTPRLG